MLFILANYLEILILHSIFVVASPQCTEWINLLTIKNQYVDNKKGNLESYKWKSKTSNFVPLSSLQELGLDYERKFVWNISKQ